MQRVRIAFMDDQRCLCMSLYGIARLVCWDVFKSEATKEEVDEIVQAFWRAWHRHADMPRRPIGTGAPYYTLEEMSPWQENAIRILEDG